MSVDFSLNSEMSREKLYGLSQKQKLYSKEEKTQEQTQQKLDPNFSGLQWLNVQTAQAAQQTGGVQKTSLQTVQTQTKSPEIASPNLEDVAMLSSAVSTKEDAVSALNIGAKIITRLGINLSALEQKFKEYYKKTKSHNLLLERFMANVQMSGINSVLSLAGVSASEIEKMKKEVREEALGEIDSKLTQDWAYAKAMIEIVG